MSEEQHGSEENGGIRINKFLASCGIDSRRVADRLIGEGRVEVNGKVIDTPGMRVTEKDFVKVDGRHMTPMEEVVVLLNKPRGYVCSREAQGAIGTVYDLLPPRLRHLNYVGRLDADSEGLLIMTNKGELTQILSHPTGGIEKEYWVTVDQNFDNSVLMQFLRGVRIPEGNARAKYVCRASARRACIVLEQGLKRQVRQMFQCLGLYVSPTYSTLLEGAKKARGEKSTAHDFASRDGQDTVNLPGNRMTDIYFIEFDEEGRMSQPNAPTRLVVVAGSAGNGKEERPTPMVDGKPGLAGGIVIYPKGNISRLRTTEQVIPN